MMPHAEWALAVSIILAASCASVGWSAPAGEEIGCAPQAVRLAFRLLGRDVSPGALGEAFQGRVSGTHSLQDIADAVESLGLKVRFVRLNPRSPRLARLPLIAAVKRSSASAEPDHFVILYGRRDDSVQLLDFPNSPFLVPCEVLAEGWDGGGLYVSASGEQLPASLADRPWVPGMLLGGALVISIVSVSLWFRTRKTQAD